MDESLTTSGLSSSEDPGCEALAANGAVVRLRPVRWSDAPALRALNRRTSDHSLYLRFFGSSRIAADRYVDQLVRTAGEDHGVLVALLGDVLVGVAGYERAAVRDAEVALLVEDGHQGEGIGMLLLEHVASLARRHGITRLVADTLVQNRRMLGVFDHSGLETHHLLRGGVVDISLVTTPDASGLDAIDERERRAELRSLRPLLAPRSIAVIGTAESSDDLGSVVVRSLVRAGFVGPIYPIALQAGSLAGRKSYASIHDIGRSVDLAVLAVPVGDVDSTVAACGAHGVRVLVVLASYLPVVDGRGPDPSRRSLLHTARRHGIRLIGPGSLGVVSTDPAVRLDTTVGTSTTPSPGGIALAAQAGVAGIGVLERATQVGAGVAAFVSLGDKVDVSGNDLLHMWDRDPRVKVIALYLESLGNPRKFGRLARRIGRHKPVVLLKRAEDDRPAGSLLPAEVTADLMIDILCEQAGIVRVATAEELIDVARVLGSVPIPAGGRVSIVTNAAEAGVHAGVAARRAGLEIVSIVDLGASAGAEEVAATWRAIVTTGEADSVLVVWMPSRPVRIQSVWAVLEEIGGSSTVPVLLVRVGGPDHPGAAGDAPAAARMPIFDSPEEAARALAHAVRYGRWLRTSPGRMLDIDREQVDRASEMIAAYLLQTPAGGWPDALQVGALLACYGIDVGQDRIVDDEPALVVSAVGDPTLGPIVIMRPARPETGSAAGWTVRTAPITDLQAQQMVLGLPASLRSPATSDDSDVTSSRVQDLLERVGRLAADHSEILEVHVEVALVGFDRTLASSAALRLGPLSDQPDSDLRKLRS